jgi:hypothetical protein
MQFEPLVRTMAAQMVAEPLFVPKLLTHVGLGPLADWMGHVGALGAYTALNRGLGGPLRQAARVLPAAQAYDVRRLVDSWEYGSGGDFKL